MPCLFIRTDSALKLWSFLHLSTQFYTNVFPLVSCHFKHLLTGQELDVEKCECHSKGEDHYAQEWSVASECQMQGAGWGPGLWAWVERCSQGGNRFSRKGQACELSAAHSIQPPELRAFILGNNVGFIICKNGAGKMGLSCSESCTGRDHLSALIESPGCRAGGSVQPSGLDKHTYIHTRIIEAWQWALWRKEHLERGQCGFVIGKVRNRIKWLFTETVFFYKYRDARILLWCQLCLFSVRFA